ncbi:uncharacterized protein DS421_9g279720 [Arachis hypogaea]|nr:uncharacterized protein DS421_9g279720 [Arachis hypogaea]
MAGNKYQSFVFSFILIIMICFNLSIPHVMARPLVNNNLGLHDSGEMLVGNDFPDSSSSSSNNDANNEDHKYDNVFRTLEQVMESGPSGGGKGH